MNTINERLQTKEEIIDDIQEMQKSRRYQVKFEKARKRIQERVEAKQKRETEVHIREKSGTIDKENEILSGYDSQLRSFDLSLVFPSFIGKSHRKI